jgi:hypothetical protein
MVVILALIGCGGGSAQEKAKARPLPEVEKALDPGEYRTEEFKPSFSFRVGEGWSMETDPPQGPDELEITWRDGTVNLFILNIKGVYEPNETGSRQRCHAPKDMVAGSSNHPT